MYNSSVSILIITEGWITTNYTTVFYSPEALLPTICNPARMPSKSLGEEMGGEVFKEISMRRVPISMKWFVIRGLREEYE